jgi:hypothetical protein
MTVVFIERAFRCLSTCLTVCLALALSACAGASRTVEPEYSVLHKGVNAWGLLTLPAKVDGNYVAEPYGRHEPGFILADFKRVKAQGFDFVRLPVDPGPFLSTSVKNWPRLLRALDVAVDAALQENLSLIVDIHSPVSDVRFNVDRVVQEINENPSGDLAKQYVELAVVIARLLQAKDAGHLLLEPFNEPGVNCERLAGAEVVSAFNKVARAVRVESKNIRLVFDSNCQSSWKSLIGMAASSVSDRKVVYSFHFYDPFLFTHQGSHWSSRTPFLRYLKNYPYPYDENKAELALRRVSERLLRDDPKSGAGVRQAFERAKPKGRGYSSEIEAAFVSIGRWARLNGIEPQNILMGEFGTLKPAEASGPLEEDRARWLADVRIQAEKSGFAWAVWEYVDVMGVVKSSDDRTLIPSVQKALNLNGVK